jgi:hypothetical protein
MNVGHLASSEDGTRRVRRSHNQSHTANSDHIEVEALAGAKPGSTDDLNLDQLPGPAADAVDGLAAEMNPAPDFTDPEFRSVRDQANVSTAASPTDVVPARDRKDPARRAP